MTGIPGVTVKQRIVWQPTEAGIPEATKVAFWAKVDRRNGHWLWTSKTPFLPLDGMNVSANRIAWALRYPGTVLPGKLYRASHLCTERTCICPDHFVAGRSHFGELQPLQRVADKYTQEQEDVPFEVPRTIEAMAHLQFGTPVKPRVLRALVKPAEEIVATPEGEITVQPLPATPHYSPSAQDKVRAPKLTVQQLMDVIFAPDTVVMTFRTGHVWISTPRVRLQADSGEEAVLGVLIMTGQHQVRG